MQIWKLNPENQSWKTTRKRKGLKLNPETKAWKTCTQEFENWILNTRAEIEFWNESWKNDPDPQQIWKLNPKKA